MLSTDIIDINYGPGIVQKLCARFLQLSKDSYNMPPIRSPRFKRCKSLAENTYAMVKEIRQCNTQMLPSELNREQENKQSNLFPATEINDAIELSGTYLYHATVIPNDTKANRRAKKIESIREIFEKISATTSTLPKKTYNINRYRRTFNLPSTANVESHSNVIKCDSNDVQLPVLNGEVRISVEFAQRDGNPPIPLIVEELTSEPSPSLPQPSYGGICDEDGLFDESHAEQMEQRSFHSESAKLSIFPAYTSTKLRVKMSKKDESNDGDSWQEVHRLLKKFRAIREERAKQIITQNLCKKDENKYGNMLDQANVHLTGNTKLRSHSADNYVNFLTHDNITENVGLNVETEVWPHVKPCVQTVFFSHEQS
ncbi:unnamed protein product [Thelazia callipaeda]|uniref:Uncharacterized protein n=1 Tax=Thelazia callipaeda TaxID=103827 RepID=A0A0N5CQZ3_THECL|nr:unnamed protein product [Thelazia callipaeda]